MAPGTAKAGRTNDPEGLRNRILDAAMGCFQSTGYRGANMRDVTRAAGTTSGALHHHFPTKTALGRAVLDERVAHAVATTWIAKVQSAPTAAEGVLAVFADVIAELEGKQRVEGCPVNNLAVELALVDPEFRERLDAIFQAWRRAIADKARADEDAGGAMPLDAEAWALLAVAQFSGAMAMAKAAQSTKPLRESADLLRRLSGLPTAM